MMAPRFASLWVAVIGGVTSGCGGIVVSDAGVDASAEGGVCAPGTCMTSEAGPCEVPTGQQGNACCRCDGDYCGYFCKCAAADTPIATPTGDRAIASLRVGDLVYSVHRGRVTVVPIAEVHRTRVTARHQVVRAELANGAVLRISPEHPTSDGRKFADLRRGDRLDDVNLIAVELVPYDEPFTYDVRPDSDTATYFAGGVLIGSTLVDASSAVWLGETL